MAQPDIYLFFFLVEIATDVLAYEVLEINIDFGVLFL